MRIPDAVETDAIRKARERHTEYQKRRYQTDAEYKAKVLATNKDYQNRVREEMLEAYGRTCACCRETEPAFLTLDHVGGKAAHPDRSAKGGWKEYVRLKRLGWPKKGVRILCMNCNWAIGRYGACPHPTQEEIVNPESS